MTTNPSAQNLWYLCGKKMYYTILIEKEEIFTFFIHIAIISSLKLNFNMTKNVLNNFFYNSDIQLIYITKFGNYLFIKDLNKEI